MKKYIRNISYIKRVTSKIRSVGSPLSKDGEKGLDLGSIQWELEGFLEFWGLGEGSKKGSTRKHTGKRVARWKFLFWRNSAVLR
jgi:hypothetical protein